MGNADRFDRYAQDAAERDSDIAAPGEFSGQDGDVTNGESPIPIRLK